MPGSPSAWDDPDPDEKDHLERELRARVRVYQEKNPECESDAAAECAIRMKDRERADAVMRRWKRGEMADVLGGVFSAGPADSDVIDAEVVNLDSDSGSDDRWGSFFLFSIRVVFFYYLLPGFFVISVSMTFFFTQWMRSFRDHGNVFISFFPLGLGICDLYFLIPTDV